MAKKIKINKKNAKGVVDIFKKQIYTIPTEKELNEFLIKNHLK